MKKRIASILAALLTAGGVLVGVVGGTAPAAHAAGCYDWGCDGQDPQAMGCSADAFTIDNFTDISYIELRYSPSCDAAWVRVSGGESLTRFAHIEGWDSGGSGGNLIRDYWVQEYGWDWSRMVPFDLWVAACAGQDAWGSAYVCTDRH